MLTKLTTDGAKSQIQRHLLLPIFAGTLLLAEIYKDVWAVICWELLARVHGVRVKYTVGGKLGKVLPATGS